MKRFKRPTKNWSKEEVALIFSGKAKKALRRINALIAKTNKPENEEVSK